MSLVVVQCVCAARAPSVAATSHLLDAITAFLVPHSLRGIVGAIERGWFALARSQLDSLARDDAIHYLDKRRRAREALRAAASSGQVALMDKIYHEFRCLIDEKAVREAVRGGNSDALRWLHARLATVERGDQQCVYSPAYSDFELLRFLSPDLLDVAAENDDLETLQTLLELMRGHFEAIGSTAEYRAVALHAAKVAARHGHDRLIQWLRPQFDIPSESELEVEAHTGPIRVEEQAPRNREQCDTCRRADGAKVCTRWRMDNAAALGRLEDVQWFHTHREEHGCSGRAIDGAAGRGHLNVVRWLSENRSAECAPAAVRSAVCSAAASGHVEIVRFLMETRREARSSAAVYCAVFEGHLDVVQYLYSVTLEWSLAEPLYTAASRGHLDMVKWLLEISTDEEKQMASLTTSRRRSPIDVAASHGHLGMVELLFAGLDQAGAEYDMSVAASGNCMDVVRWFATRQRDNGGSDNQDKHMTRMRSRATSALHNLPCAVYMAAGCGNLEMTQFLYEKLQQKRVGLDRAATASVQRWMLSAVRNAARAAHLDVLKWLVRTEYRTDPSKALREARSEAVRRGHGSIVHWILAHPQRIREHQVDREDLDCGMEIASRVGDFGLLEWLCTIAHDHSRALRTAASTGNIETLQWLVGEAGDGSGAMKRTLRVGERAELAALAERSHAWCVLRWLSPE